ncbi:hypothetical protein GGP55_003295 [Salinibacter ruber]|uniref:YfjI family protein n=1 Tax=Salinibacter ruber TaxID=146919 RepID=UPI0021695B59|nr:YfjI family protein [Salinibacter ruber]MCS3632673.1 hypothetical protein [Salinibacter ruber]
MSDDSEDPIVNLASLNNHLSPDGDGTPKQWIEEGKVPVRIFEEEILANGKLQKEKQKLKEKIETLREENQRLRSASVSSPEAPAREAYEPFPTDSLPSTPREYVKAASEALDVPPAFLAVPMLSVLSAGVGASAQLRLKRSWREPATLWTAVVAPSGSTKSAALQHVLRPVNKHEREALQSYEAALERHDPDGDSPRPVRKRYRTGDPTTEAVVRILDDNPRGVLLARDELAAWLGSFDRYAHGAADLQFWIEIWNGVQVSRDRVGEGNVTVSHPAVPLAGTIQPSTLIEKMGEIHFQSGFASRLILCKPPVTPKTWTEADVTPEVEDQYGRLLRTLYALEDRMEDGAPAVTHLSPKAKEAWISFYDTENERLYRETDDATRAARAKAINHGARIALIFHLCRVAVGEREPGPVDRQILEDGLTVARWCLNETLRVYDMLGLKTATLDPRDQLLQRMAETFTTAEAQAEAGAFDVTERTIRSWIGKLQADGKVTKLSRGTYRKT